MGGKQEGERNIQKFGRWRMIWKDDSFAIDRVVRSFEEKGKSLAIRVLLFWSQCGSEGDLKLVRRA
jgi:hypothetical protein